MPRMGHFFMGLANIGETRHKHRISPQIGGVFMFGFFETIVQSLILLVSYIANNNSFPKPLSAKEEREYLERYQNGDAEAKNKLIEHNLRLVAHIAKKYYSITNDQDDLISIGTIGLIKAVGTFQYEKGTRFATYGARCIENAILS